MAGLNQNNYSTSTLFYKSNKEFDEIPTRANHSSRMLDASLPESGIPDLSERWKAALPNEIKSQNSSRHVTVDFIGSALACLDEKRH